MNIPLNIEDLATQLVAKDFKRLTSLTDLVGGSALGFFDNIDPSKTIFNPHFPRYIPIIRERVSVKKHDYKLSTHVVFWLADDEPYIFTPEPTIEHIRQGKKVSKLTRGEHLMIPHNCKAFDILALREGRCNDVNNTPIVDLVITRYGVK